MSQESNKAIVRRAYQILADGLASGNLDAIDDLVAPDIRDHNPDPGQGPGRDGIKAWFRDLGRAFPDLEIRVDDLIAEDDKVVARTRLVGTHAGEFQGIPATRREVQTQVIDILRIEDGRVVERWGLADQAGMMQQLGVLPPAAASPPLPS
jgi:steroid delta-isomerase-like uncharacterized protein